MKVFITRTRIETVVDTELPSWFEVVLRVLMNSHMKITAVTAFRSYMQEQGHAGVGLKEAKEFIEREFEDASCHYDEYLAEILTSTNAR